jgi:ribosomal protein S18 acetylase RimI-like enzyme
MDSSKAATLSIRPASILENEERRQALSFFFASAASHERQWRIERLLLAFERNELDHSLFLTYWSAREVLGCLVCEVLPGRAASLWPIQVQTGASRVEVEQSLISRALELIAARGAKFAQTLLPFHDNERPDALLRNGFNRITQIWNMHCDLPHSDAPPEMAVRLTARDENNSLEFQRMISSTFAGSLDCPEFNNIRTAEEVYAGYLAGTPDPTRWWLASHQDEPIGVLILGDGASAELRDLSYLGVVPRARKRGFGRQLLAFAFQKTIESGATGMTLLVDGRNQPAINLYHQYGFRQFEVRHLFLRPIVA